MCGVVCFICDLFNDVVGPHNIVSRGRFATECFLECVIER